MKKIFSIAFVLGAGLILASCNKEEDLLFSQSAAERLEAYQTVYTERLSAPEAGWAMEYYPTSDVINPKGKTTEAEDFNFVLGHVITMKFAKAGSVDMSAYNILQDGKTRTQTSTWNIITDQGPVLSFNTYNDCLHPYSDPGISSNYTGNGYEGDYEFSVISLEEGADIAMTKGKKHSVYERLTKIDAGTSFSDYITDINSFNELITHCDSVELPILKVGDTKFRVGYLSYGIANIYPYDGDYISNEDYYPFLFTKRGGKHYLRFRDAVKKDSLGETVQEFVYDETNDEFTSVDDANAKIYVEKSPVEYLTANLGSHNYKILRSGNNSESVQKIIDNIYTTYYKINKKYGITKYNFRTTEDGHLVVSCKYSENDSKAATLSYTYKMTVDGNNITLNLETIGDGSGSNQSVNHLTRIQTLIKDILDGKTFTVSTYETRFDYSKVKLTSTEDANTWFTLNY